MRSDDSIAKKHCSVYYKRIRSSNEHLLKGAEERNVERRFHTLLEKMEVTAKDNRMVVVCGIYTMFEKHS